MIKHLYLFTALILMASLCHAMKRTLDTATSENITTLTVIKNPESVICFPDNIVAILGGDGCSLCNLSTGKEIKKLTNYTEHSFSQSIAAHPNKKLLALWYKNNLEIYDVATKSKIWGNNSEYWQNPPVFNSIDNTILIGSSFHTIKSFNYINNSYQPYHLNFMTGEVKISSHPTKQEIMLCPSNLSTLHILQLDKKSLIKKSFPIKEYITGFSKYSPDGSLVAINCVEYGCSILDPKSRLRNWLIGDKNEPFCAMAFHPTSFILAILPNSGKHICYWNTKTRQLITTTPLISNNDRLYPNSFSQRLDFSYNGTQLIVALFAKCLVLDVPFEALYKSLTKDHCISALWILKHYLHDGNILPPDITHFLIYNLLVASKYSLTND